MKHRRPRLAGWTVVLTLVALLLLGGAGLGVLRLIDYRDSYADGAADAAVVSEQIQVLAVVAAQAALPASDLAAIRATGLAAGIEASATLERLRKSGVAPRQVRTLIRRLNEYFNSLALVESLFAVDDVVQARTVSGGTAGLVAPITAMAHDLQLELRARAATTSQAARLGSVFLLVFAGGTIAILTAVVERRRRREAVSAADYAARARFEAMVEHTVDLMIVMDAEGLVTFVSPALFPLLGYEVDTWIGTRRSSVIHRDDSALVNRAFSRVVADGAPTRLDFRIRHVDGSWRVFEADVTRLVTGDDAYGVLWTARDITAQRDLEDQLRRQAFEDSLTGLANRAVLHDRLAQAMARATRLDEEVAVLLLDLDNFKEINDSFGHAVGDTALVEVADALVSAVREGDTVARLGGDEFVVVIEAAAAAEVAEELALRIHDVLSVAIPVADSDIRLTASVGAVVATATATSDDVLRDADLAMYRAKALGGGHTVFFRRQMLHDAQTRRDLALELNRALDRSELELYYQPITDMLTSEVVGAEALLRWHNPERGMVPPDVFIPIAERSDAIVAIGGWVLAEACRQTAIWSSSLPDKIQSMHVNVSAHQLAEPTFVSVVAATLEATGVEPHVLVIELTESVLAEDNASLIKCVHDLKALGVRIAIDDFGTGYSSLSKLAQLPIDILKIDRSFVQAVGEGRTSEHRLVRSILSMTDSLDMEPIAEGVEHLHELVSMQDAGCRLGQGYLLGRPMPAAQFFEVVGGDLLATAGGSRLRG